MADVVKTVSVIFQGQDNVSAVAANIANSLKFDTSGASGLELTFRDIGDAATFASTRLNSFELTFRDLNAAAASTDSKLEGVESGFKELGAAAAAADGKLEGVEAGLKETGAAASGANTHIDGTEKSMRTATTSASDLYRTLQLLATGIVVKEFIDANVAIESFGRAMTLVQGSSAEAGNSLAYIRSISNTLGLEITSTASSFVSLAAASQGTALEGQATRDIFEAISKAMSLLGKSASETQGALLAVQQMISKGTVSAEELRGQLGERLPGAFQIAARAMGVTTAELGELTKSGDLLATEFLPKLAAELNKTFGDTTYVSTFNAEWNRTINAFKELAITVGNAGVFDLLTKSLINTTNVLKGMAVDIETAAKNIQLLRDLAKGNISFEDYQKATEALVIGADSARAGFTNLNESLAETERLIRQATTAGVDWATSTNQSSAESRRLGTDQFSAVSKLAGAYELLGISATKVNKDFIGGLETIVASADSTSAEISKAFQIVIPKIQNVEELERFMAASTQAATDGKQTWAQWAVTADKATEAFLKNSGYVKENASEIKKQTDEVKKAEEAAKKLELELEKLASNERIKNMEFKVQLDIAQLEADTKRVEAAFDSINNTMNSTGDVISSALGLLKDFDSLDWGAIRTIETQLEKENAIRRENFELQKKLTEAQIANINAQTRNLEKGDAIIKIDGAGLQPHLEAFMWEILRTIQTRVNSQGLSMLLGV